MKSCIQCQSKSVVKNGKRLGKQRYLCRSCNHVWELGKSKKSTKEDDIKLLHEYVINDAKYSQLGVNLGISKQQIQKKLDNVGFEKNL